MKIDVKGVIVTNDDKWIYDWFDVEAVSPKDITQQIDKANGEELEIEINSGGGDVYAGSEIYTALKNYKGNVITKIVGLAASAASVIAMAGKKVMISPTAQIMIHNVWEVVAGDNKTFEHEAQVLKGHDAGVANAYMLKTGKTQKELLDLMSKTTYFNAQQALENKFVDEIMFDTQSRLAASTYNAAMIPPAVLNKMRNMIKNQNPDGIKLAQAKLNFLKLKEDTVNE